MPHDSDIPQLRTLLLTDLCDSTQLVEGLGDAAAASLFRDHDRLVLELQQRWRGRLIDRSDGLLLLFERPLDGLGFALDYRRSLDALGQAHRTGGPLLARAGLHVGEVLIWRNSEEAVSAGAKQVEVEGLAKPFAARLMHLARPGQILLSSVAQPLVHRAARELGERGDALQWRTHGRWQFKGVPEVQEIYEVGEPDLAPLRAPRGDAKARRDMPMWRRPAALVVEVVLVICVAVGGWFMTRPEPAIAFSERDWVVVGDLRNTTGQTILDDSLQQAFRLSLEQSRYVNVLSELKVRDTLGRMRKPADAFVDRELASEIAIRDGASAVVLPAVSEVGGRMHVSLELLDPRSNKTLYATSADGDSMESVLDSIDRVTASLRSTLGESMGALAQDSKPLPQVATQSLDALRAYALGQEAYGQGNYVLARDFYLRAIALDPEFALAHMGAMRAYNVMDELPKGIPFLNRARELRSDMSGRDQVYLDSWVVQVEEPSRSADAWALMARMYPDFFPALANAAYALEVQNQHEPAQELANRAAVPQSEFGALSLELLGRMQLARGQQPAALASFREAGKRGLASARVWESAAHAVSRNFSAAEKAWPADDLLKLTYFERVSIYLDEGRWAQAKAESVRLEDRARTADARFRQSQFPAAVALWAAGENDEAGKKLAQAAEMALESLRKPTSAMDQRDDATLALHAALLMQRMEDGEMAQRVVRELEAHPKIAGAQPVRALLTVARARASLLAGDAAQAIATLDPILDGTEPLQAQVALMEAKLMSGDAAGALQAAKWLASRRGQAYAEYGCAWCQQSLNVLDTRLADRQVAALGGGQTGMENLRQLLASRKLPPAQVLSDQSSLRRGSDATFN